MMEQRVERLASRIQALNTVITHDKYRDLLTGLRLGAEEIENVPTTQEKKDSHPRSPEELREKFKTGTQDGSRLRVGIIGRVKAGKSSLLNALLFDGKDVLPKAATPMTASLTVLGYAAKPYAEVEFFEEKDIENMCQRAQDYDLEFERRMKERLEKNQARPSRFGSRSAQAVPDPARLEAIVRRELDEDPTLGGSKRLFDEIEKAKKAGSLPPTLGEHIEGKDIQALLDKLGDYVGAAGKLTPFTKCMSIYLPLEPLKDLEVVDTPGVNDPIVSREKRTFDELHKCHAVIVVSPSGQFLSVQDLNLMQRLVKQDGVAEVFLAASQIDGQLFSSEYKRHGGRLPAVIQGLRDTLAEQARSTLPAPQEGSKGLDTLKRELDMRLVVTSSVAYTLSSQPQSTWDENARHIHGMLRENYPAEFAKSHEAARPHYDALAGIKQTRALLDQVRGRRQAIIESNLQSFLDAQEKALQQRLEDIPRAIIEQRAKVESTDGVALEQQLKDIQQFRQKGTRVVDATVSAVAQNVASRVYEHMTAMVDKVLADLRRTSEQAKGTTTNSYTVKSDGFFAFIANKIWGGGTEKRTETISTVNATEVRSFIVKVHSEISKHLIGTVAKARGALRPELESNILRELREKKVVNDKNIDITILFQSCQTVMVKLRDFDEPMLPQLPDVLMQSGILKSSAAERFEAEAIRYFKQLQQASYKAANELTKDFESRLNSVSIGSKLFEDYEEKIQILQNQIQKKDQTLQRYDSLLKELKGLQ
jgi:hypothetical protein